MPTAAAGASIDVRDVVPSERHATVFEAFRVLALGDALDVVDDCDLKPLYHRFQAEAPGDFSWACQEGGPQVWRVSIRKLGRAHGAGECCGVCCSGA